MRLAKGLTLLFALTISASLQARDIDFNYLDVSVGIYDLDFDETLTAGADSLNLETDSDTSFYVKGAWQPYQGSVGWFTRLHVFAAASTAKNDVDGALTLGGTTVSASGDLEVVQGRLGLGYHQPLLDNLNVYGRITWDYIQLKDVDFGNTNFEDVDESGIGVETGVRWLFAGNFEVQAYLRWSEDAAIKSDSLDELKTEDDTLGGIAGRWYFAENWALQVNGEFGDTSNFGGGIRFSF